MIRFLANQIVPMGIPVPINLAAKPWYIRRQFPMPEGFSAFFHQITLVFSAFRRTAAISIEAKVFLPAHFTGIRTLSGFFSFNAAPGIDCLPVCFVARLFLASIFFSLSFWGAFRAIALCAAHDGIGLAAHLAGSSLPIWRDSP